VVSLASNDAERFLQAVHHLPHLVLTPIDFLIFAAVLYADLGAAAFAGLALLVLVSGAQVAAYARAFGPLRRARAATTDTRLTLTAQVLGGVRCVKANGWEPPFFAAAAALRAEEVAQLRAQYAVRGTFEGLIHSKYLLVAGAALLALWARGEALTPARVYSALTLFYLLDMDRVWRFVENAENLSDLFVSLARFEAFLALPEAAVSAADAGAEAAAAGAVAVPVAGAAAAAAAASRRRSPAAATGGRRRAGRCCSSSRRRAAASSRRSRRSSSRRSRRRSNSSSSTSSSRCRCRCRCSSSSAQCPNTRARARLAT
jgi:hypothetical protein